MTFHKFLQFNTVHLFNQLISAISSKQEEESKRNKQQVSKNDVFLTSRLCLHLYVLQRHTAVPQTLLWMARCIARRAQNLAVPCASVATGASPWLARPPPPAPAPRRASTNGMLQCRFVKVSLKILSEIPWTKSGGDYPPLLAELSLWKTGAGVANSVFNQCLGLGCICQIPHNNKWVSQEP